MALLLKDGLIQVRLPQVDADRFREIVEERTKTTASEALRRYIYRIIEEDDKRLSEASRRSGGLVPPVAPVSSSLSRAQRRAANRAEKKGRA